MALPLLRLPNIIRTYCPNLELLEIGWKLLKESHIGDVRHRKAVSRHSHKQLKFSNMRITKLLTENSFFLDASIEFLTFVKSTRTGKLEEVQIRPGEKAGLECLLCADWARCHLMSKHADGKLLFDFF